jgi:hypothetical protein
MWEITRPEAELDPEKFKQLIDEIFRSDNPLIKRRATLAKFLEVIGGGMSPSNLSRQIENKAISTHHRHLICEYIFVTGLVFSAAWRERARGFAHFLYFALMEFFDIKDTSQSNARSLICGTYEFWRYSVEHDDEFVHGRLEFTTDRNCGAVCVEEWQPKKSRDGLRDTSEEFEGYFIRIADMYAILVKDKSSNDLRVTIFPRFRSEFIGKHRDKDSEFPERTKHIVHLYGFDIGVDGNNFFFSPVFVTLVDNETKLAELDQELDVVPRDEVPTRILKWLRKYPPIVI